VVIRPTNDLGQESFVGFDSISGRPEWQLHTLFLGPGAYCKKEIRRLRGKIRLYTEAPISLSLLFGLFENEFLNVTVDLVLLYAGG
jgi:hypothetical protein